MQFPHYAVDDARRRHFEAAGRHYENERALLICYAPPPQQIAKLTDLLFTGGTSRPTTITRAMEFFSEELSRFENRVAGTIGLERMTSFAVADALGGEGRQDPREDREGWHGLTIDADPDAG